MHKGCIIKNKIQENFKAVDKNMIKWTQHWYFTYYFVLEWVWSLIFCSIVVYPVIPKGLILLRMIPTATHTLQDVSDTLDAFDAIRDRLENGTYKRLSAAVMAAMGEWVVHIRIL